MDFDSGSKKIFNTLLITLVAPILIGGAVIVHFANQLTSPIKAIVEQIKQVATGDLRRNMTVRSKDEVGQLAQSINEMIISYRGLISGIIQSSHNVASASGQISASTEQVASSSVQQAESAQTMDHLLQELNLLSVLSLCMRSRQQNCPIRPQ
jgi:methyl-accepting chemotaxis protein